MPRHFGSPTPRPANDNGRLAGLVFAICGLLALACVVVIGLGLAGVVLR